MMDTSCTECYNTVSKIGKEEEIMNYLTDEVRRNELQEIAENSVLEQIDTIFKNQAATEKAKIITDLAACIQVRIPSVDLSFKSKLSAYCYSVIVALRKKHKDCEFTGHANEDTRDLLINVFDKKNFYSDYEEVA